MGVKSEGKSLSGRSNNRTTKYAPDNVVLRMLSISPSPNCDSDYQTDHELFEVNVINKEKLVLRFKNGSSIEAIGLLEQMA